MNKDLEKVIESIKEKSVENGYTHFGETLLSEYFLFNPDFEDDLIEILFSEAYKGYSADILRLLARMPPDNIEFRVDIVSRAIKSENVDMRDASVYAIENWGNKECVAILKDYRDEVRWLQEYARMVYQDFR